MRTLCRRADGTHADKHCAQHGPRCRNTFSVTHTCPSAFSVCRYTHLAILHTGRQVAGQSGLDQPFL